MKTLWSILVGGSFYFCPKGCLKLSGTPPGSPGGKFSIGVSLLLSVLTCNAGWVDKTPTGSSPLNGLAYGNGTFVAAGDYGTVKRSTDFGETWTHQSIGAKTGLGVAFGSNTFVTVGQYGYISRSVDNGATWTESSSPVMLDINSVAYGEGKFVAVGAQGYIYRSSDFGQLFTYASNSSFEWSAVAYGNGIFLAVGRWGWICRSEDGGQTWTLSAPGSMDLKGIAFGNGAFIAAGAGAQAYRTTDGVNWETLSLPSAQDKSTVAFGDGRFVIGCVNGTVFESDPADYTVWTETAIGGDQLKGSAFGNHVFAVGGMDSATHGPALYTKGTSIFSLDPASSSLPAGSASGGFNVSAPGGFFWEATTTNSWVHISLGTTGTGSSRVEYTVDSNSGTAARQAVIDVAGHSHTIMQAGGTDPTTISPLQAGFPYYGGTGTVAVVAPPGRNWTATPNNTSMINILSGASGSSTGTVVYTVRTNLTSQIRSGYISVTGSAYSHTIRQQPFVVSLSPTGTNLSYAAASGTFGVTVSTGTIWHPATTNSWIHIDSYSGTNSGTVQFSVDENIMPSSRTGEITLLGQTYTIYQSGQFFTVLLDISPPSLSHGSGASTGRFEVVTSDSHIWTAHESVGWVTIQGSGPYGYLGVGSGQVTYIVDPNPGSADRNGFISIEGHHHSISQARSGRSVSPVGGTYPAWDSSPIRGSFDVVLPAGTAWNVSSTQTWITGVGKVGKFNPVSCSFTVGNNPTLNARIGAVDVDYGVSGHMQYQVYQLPGSLDISPAAANIDEAGGNGQIQVTATPSVQWMAASDRSWITLTSGAGGTGSGAISYQVAPNTTYAERSGSIIVGDRQFMITQAARPPVFTIDPYQAEFNESGHTSSVQVFGPPDRSWTAQETLSWVEITSGSNGMGEGLVRYQVDPNPNLGSRTGSLTIAGETHNISQSGSLHFYVYPASISFSDQGGSQRVSVSSIPAGEAWTVVSEVPWVQIIQTNGSSFDIRVLPNTSVSNRSGKVRAGSDLYSTYTFLPVGQGGTTPSFSVSPVNVEIRGSGAGGNINVTATEGAGWGSGPPPAWLNLQGASGVGSGVVHYSADANPYTNNRIAVVTIAGIPCTFNQSSGDSPTGCRVVPGAIMENLPAGSTVGTLQSESYLPIPNPVFSLQPLPGNDNASFSIIQTNKLITAEPLDADLNRDYYPGIRVENGRGDYWEGLVSVAVGNDTMEDADADGLPEEDEAAQGLRDDEPDADGDGLLDGDELRITGTDPLDFLSALRISNFDLLGASFKLQWSTITGKTYRVMASDHLPAGFPYLLAETTNGYYSASTSPSPSRCYRLEVNAPRVQQVQQVTAYDAAPEDRFGDKVAVDGNTLVVGAKFNDELGSNSGSAYLYERGISNQWNFVVKLMASDGAAGDQFGYSVDIDGDTIVVGAKTDDSARGSAYVFERNAGGPGHWGQTAKLVASDRAASDYFGYDVAVSGDRIAVGALWENGRRGAVYLYERNAGGAGNWGQIMKLSASDAAADDNFGCAVSLSGNTVAVGAYHDDDFGVDSGSAYLFNRDQGGPGNWGEVRKVSGVGEQAGDSFGNDLALDGDTLAVAADMDDERANNAGAAYVFYRNQGGAEHWGMVRKIRTRYASSFGLMGSGIDLDGDNLLIGAWNAYNSVGIKSGVAYLYQRNLNGPDRWGLLQSFVPAPPDNVRSFGWKVGVSGSTIAVGGMDDTMPSNAGAVYLFQVALP